MIGNYATIGGGICWVVRQDDAQLTLKNSYIYDNWGQGIAIISETQHTYSIDNCNVVYNGGIYASDISFRGSGITIIGFASGTISNTGVTMNEGYSTYFLEWRLYWISMFLL
jgi:hypothetical protein